MHRSRISIQLPRLRALGLALGLSSASVISVQPAVGAPGPVRLTVYNEVENVISSGIFGQFMERSGSEPGPENAFVNDAPSGFQRSDVLAHLRQMHMTSMRFPGGAEVEFGERWTSLVDQPNTDGASPRKANLRFGFHEFLTLAQSLGADPVLVVSIGGPLVEGRSMTLADSVALAAGMVAYFNSPVDDPSLPENLRQWPRLRAANGRPEPFKVKLWQLGNEPFLIFPGALRKTRNATGEQIAETYVEFLRAHLRAMRAVDPSIQVIAEAHMDDVPVLPLLTRELGDQIDYYSYHIYRPWGVKSVLKDGEPVAPGGFSLADFHATIAAVPFIDATTGLSTFSPEALPALRATGRPLAVTEWNLNHWWASEDLKSMPESFMSKGVGAAGFLHGFMRAGDVVKLAHQSMLVGGNWAIAAVRVKPDDPGFIHWRATGQVTALYARHHGDELLRVKIEDNTFYRQPFKMEGIAPAERVAHVDPLVTRRGNTVYVHAINRDLTFERTLAVDLQALGAGRPAKILAHRVVGPVLDDLKSTNAHEFSRLLTETLEIPETTSAAETLRLSLPAASVSVFEVQLPGS